MGVGEGEENSKGNPGKYQHLQNGRKSPEADFLQTKGRETFNLGRTGDLGGSTLKGMVEEKAKLEWVDSACVSVEVKRMSADSCLRRL